MAMIRAVLHMHPAPDDPPRVLRRINQHFRYLWETGIFATAIYGVLDVGRASLRVSCAGHPMPLLARASEGVVTLPVDAVVPLLLMELEEVPCSEQALKPGDRILLYTDGITERESRDGAMYDEARLVSVLTRAAAFKPAAIVEGLVMDLDAFGAGVEPHDDQTLLLIGFDG
jgi:sigma-B regulation protein RsbU (phosphoserine phosphatase)